MNCRGLVSGEGVIAMNDTVYVVSGFIAVVLGYPTLAAIYWLCLAPGRKP